MENAKKVEAYFMEAINYSWNHKGKRKRIDAWCWIWFWCECLEKMIVEKHFTGGSSNKIYWESYLFTITLAIDTFIVALQESLAELK
jgi:hypothetical protein